MSRRTQRVSDLLRDELSTLLQHEAKDPRLVGLFSITQVDLSPDFKSARVFVSVLGTPEEKATLFEGLEAVAPFLQREIRARTHLRVSPALEFRADDRIEEGARISALLADVSPPPPRDRRES